MKTYNNFRVEVSRLRQLYFTAKYAADETASSVVKKLRSGELDGSSRLYFAAREDDKYLISSSIFALGHRLKRQFPRYLRDLIFIRAISALEVFLVDSVREVFALTKEPFKRNYVVEIPQAELLSAESLSEVFTKLINKECRNLHSGGFNDIKKYYLRVFGINFADYCTILRLEEYHDRRHLLVHRLGATDPAYQRKYNTQQKKLTVEEPYLLECIDTLLTFASAVNEELDRRFTSITVPAATTPSVLYKIVAILETESAKNLVLGTFQFWADNRLIFLRDILSSSTYLDENTVELNLAGDRAAVKQYLRKLKQYEKMGELTILARQGQNLESCKLSAEEISKIRASLPEKPWPVSIHKVIAAKLGLKTSEVYKAISLIVREDTED